MVLVFVLVFVFWFGFGFGFGLVFGFGFGFLIGFEGIRLSLGSRAAPVGALSVDGNNSASDFTMSFSKDTLRYL